MRKNQTAVLCLGLLVSFINLSTAEEVKKVSCTGKVVNAQGKPVAGAQVRLYELLTGELSGSYEIKSVQEEITNSEGTFSFSLSVRKRGYQSARVVAERQGLAIGSAGWPISIGNPDVELRVKLGEPKKLSGVVIDESNEPIAGAKVSIHGLGIIGVPGSVLSKLFNVRTDSGGRFAFANVPADAKVRLVVEKTGRATVDSTFTPDNKDIKIEMSVEAKIEGIVVETDSRKPVSNVRLSSPVPGQAAVVSREDGTFRIRALTGGKHTLQMVRPGQRLAEWVAEPVEVTVETGKTKGGVEVEVSKGGLLEVIFTDAATKIPVEDAWASVRRAKPFMSLFRQSDRNGVVRMRLLPGEYVFGSVSKKPFYRRESPRVPFVIEEGKTESIEWPLVPLSRITGVVRDETGRPVGSAKVRVGGAGRSRSVTDANGRFEAQWNPERSRTMVARHEERNLVAVLEIDKDTQMVDVTLKAGVISKGKFVDPQGNGISGVKIGLREELFGRWSQLAGRNTVYTDAKGNFEVRAVTPGHRYRMSASAEGYVGKQVMFHTDNAVDNRLELGELTLMVPGVVLDAEGKPVSNVKAFIEGVKEPTRLVPGAGQACWSSDGAKIAYARMPQGYEAGICVLTLDGAGESKQITSDGKDPALSPDGKWIAYVREGQKGYRETVWLVSADGKSEPTFLAEGGYPNWLPDSKAIIYRSREDKTVYQMDITEGKRQKKKLLDMPICWYPCLSPDGNEIAYTDGEGGLLISRLDGTGMRKRHIPSGGFLGEWSPDGKRIAFGGFFYSETGLCLVDASLTDELWVLIPGNWSRPSWSPDGRFLIYDAMEDSTEVWILNMERLMVPGLVSPVGKPLPDFADVKIDFSPSQAKEKMLLVCLWDMEQRPSRNCIIRLAKQVQQLKQKGVTIVSVQASKIDESALNEWVKNYNIPFPVGMVQGDEEKTRFTWGVRSLPWLILTDRKHIVSSSGFALAELSKKIEEIIEKQD